TTGDFQFTSTDTGATFECRVDGAAFAACASPFATAALTEGVHTFDVRAIDAAGNADPTPATFTWTLDLTAPNTTILTQPTTPTSAPIGHFTFSSTEGGSTFECSVDSATFVACTTPFATAALASGSHNFRVRAIYPAGNVDASPASFTW